MQIFDFFVHSISFASDLEYSQFNNGITLAKMTISLVIYYSRPMANASGTATRFCSAEKPEIMPIQNCGAGAKGG